MVADREIANRTTSGVFQYQLAKEVSALIDLRIGVHLVAKAHNRFAERWRIPGKLARLGAGQRPSDEKARAANQEDHAACEECEDSAISKHIRLILARPSHRLPASARSEPECDPRLSVPLSYRTDLLTIRRTPSIDKCARSARNLVL